MDEPFSSSSHTKSVREEPRAKNQWWQVDFVKTTKVNLVVVFNRIDHCCAARIHGATVYAGAKKCGTINYIRGRSIYYFPCGGAEAKFVKLVSEREYLTLVEVQVWGGAKAITGISNLAYRKPVSTSLRSNWQPQYIANDGFHCARGAENSVNINTNNPKESLFKLRINLQSKLTAIM